MKNILAATLIALSSAVLPVSAEASTPERYVALKGNDGLCLMVDAHHGELYDRAYELAKQITDDPRLIHVDIAIPFEYELTRSQLKYGVVGCDVPTDYMDPNHNEYMIAADSLIMNSKDVSCMDWMDTYQVATKPISSYAICSPYYRGFPF
jgi:hypothetical protein